MTRQPSGDAELTLAVTLRKISFGDGIGGMERAAALHIDQMRLSGVTVTLYTPVRFLTGTVPHGVDVVDVPWPRWNSGTGTPTFGIAYYLWVRRLAGALAASRHDVIHLHGASAGVLRYLAVGTAAVVNPHGMEEFERASFTRLPNRLICRWLGRQGRRAERVIATDESLVDTVVTNIGVSADRVLVIPNSVDLTALARFREERQERGPFTIVSIGRLVRNKGYDMLADALADQRVRQTLPAGWRWTHYGSGPEAGRIRAQAARASELPLEILSGRSDDEVQRALAAADVFVQPSRHEGSSLTTLEAMAHGVTIVATAVGGIPDKISDGTTGFLAGTPTPDGIAEALLRAVASSKPVGDRAQALVAEKFSVEATSAAYLALYDAIRPQRVGQAR